MRVVGIFQGQIPRQALETATDRETIVNEITTATSLTITANNPILLDLLGRSSPRLIGLAWQVEALSMERTPIPTRGGTNGKSEIASFSVECPSHSLSSSCSGPLNLEAYYPTDNDAIPWIPPLLVVRWSPFCDEIIGMNYSLTVSDGTSSYINTRNLNWPDGPIRGQDLSSQPNAEIRASLIIVNQWNDSGREVTWNSQFRRGNNYNWTTSATFTRREGREERTYSVTTGTRNFNLGLKMPTNPEPSDGSTIASGREITLAWNIPEPTNWSRDYLDQLLTMRGSGHSNKSK